MKVIEISDPPHAQISMWVYIDEKIIQYQTSKNHNNSLVTDSKEVTKNEKPDEEFNE